MKLQELLESKQYTKEQVLQLLDTYGFGDITVMFNNQAIDNMVENFDKCLPFINCVGTLSLRQYSVEREFDTLNPFYLYRCPYYTEMTLEEAKIVVDNRKYANDRNYELIAEFFNRVQKITNVRFRVNTNLPTQVIYAYKPKTINMR